MLRQSSIAMRLVAIATIVVVAIGIASRANAQTYVATEIGTFGGASSTATDINNFGVVCGHAKDAAGRDKAFRWANGVLISLDSLGGDNSRAYGINDSSRIAGEAQDGAGAYRAVRWQAEGVLQLPDLGGAFSRSFDLNNDNMVVGESQIPDSHIHAFKWTLAGGMIDLAVIPNPGAIGSEARGVSSNGIIAGQASEPLGR